MIIHSITPLDFLREAPTDEPTSLRQIAGGYVEGRHTSQGFQSTRLCSTNPAMYLKNEYAPGSILPPQAHF